MGVSDGQKCNAAVLNAAFADKNFQTIATGTQFTIADNQASPANVTGLILDKTKLRTQVIHWQVYRKSTGGGGQTRVQVGRMFCYWDDSSWHLEQEVLSVADAGVIFDINTSSGQITYTSDANGGTYAAGTSYMTYQPELTLSL